MGSAVIRVIAIIAVTVTAIAIIDWTERVIIVIAIAQLAITEQ